MITIITILFLFVLKSEPAFWKGRPFTTTSIFQKGGKRPAEQKDVLSNSTYFWPPFCKRTCYLPLRGHATTTENYTIQTISLVRPTMRIINSKDEECFSIAPFIISVISLNVSFCITSFVALYCDGCVLYPWYLLYLKVRINILSIEIVILILDHINGYIYCYEFSIIYCHLNSIHKRVYNR